MTDRRLWQLRNIEIHKRRLSHTAYFLLACLTDWLYTDKAETADEFPLSVTRAGRWLKLKDDETIYGYINELVTAGILFRLGYTQRTPRTALFKIPLDDLVKNHLPAKKQTPRPKIRR